MNTIKTITAPPGLQRCNAKAFFDILDRIDLTALKDVITGPERRGRKLKGLDLAIRLYLWCIWCQTTRSSDTITVAGLRRELEDQGSPLAKLCRFDEKGKLPDRTTISNHIQRINEHPELVRDVLLAINGLVAYTPLGKSSSKTKKAEKEASSRKGSESKNRDKENSEYRHHRPKEALGHRELTPLVIDKDSANETMLNATHGNRPKCHICPEKRAKGWTCTKKHLHDVVVEMPRKVNKPRQWKCHCCEQKLSITSGTVLHGTNFSSQEILIALYHMVHSRQGIAAQELAGYLNEKGHDVSEGAARMLMHRLRECMREEPFERFAGETEIDEMLLRLNDGSRVSILTAYNRPTRRVRFRIIEREGKKKPKANQREMLKFIRDTTMLGSIILTDGDASVPKPEVMGRQHGTVNHKTRQFLAYSDLKGTLDKPVEVTVNRAERVHGFVRRTLRIRNGISRHHLERYLIEAMWRINYLHNRLESQNYEGDERRNFSLMLGVLAGAAGRKITLKDLRGAPQKKRDKSSKRTMTAPVPSDERPEQKILVSYTLIVPGAQQAENDKAEVKPSQSCPSPTPHPVPASHEKPKQRFLPLPKHVFARRPKSDKVKPDQPCPSQTRRRVRPYHEKPKQQPLAPYEKDKAMGKPAPTGPLEEREQPFVA